MMSLYSSGRGFSLMAASLIMMVVMKAHGTEIRLSVTDAKTKVPVADASVEVSQPPDQKKETLATNTFGDCLLPLSQERPRYVTVRVAKDGYVPKLIRWNTENPEFHLPKDFTLQLEKARTIGGVVTDEAGKPVPGATALIIIRASDTDRGQQIHDDIWERKAATDEQGRWSFNGAPSSLKYLHIRLTHPEFVDSTPGVLEINPQDFFDGKTRLVMKAGRLIEGTVRDQAGTALENVAVLMNQHGSDSTTEPEYKTDASGHFIIRNAPKRTQGQNGALLTFFKKGFAPEMSVVPPGTEPTKLEIVLPPAMRLEGRVIDSAGKPIEGVIVAPDYWRNARPFACNLMRTDADGRFVWEDAPADEVVFDFLKDGYSALRNVPLTAGTQSTLTMARPVSVSATVVDAKTGDPIPGFTITPGTEWSTGRKYTSREMALAGKNGSFQWCFDEPAAMQGHDGKVSEKGGHFLRVLAPGYVLTDSPSIKDSEESVKLEFRLKKGADSVILVQTKDRKPIAGAVVAVAGEGNPLQINDGSLYNRGDCLIVTADEKGQVVLPALEGNPTLVVSDPVEGFASLTLENARRDGVTLTPWGKVVVHSPAIKAGKQPPFYLNYEPILAGEPGTFPIFYIENRGQIPNDGTLVFKAVKPGTARVGRFGKSDESAMEVNVPEGREATLSLPGNDGIAGAE